MDTFDRSIAVNLRADVAGRGEPGLAVTRVPAYGAHLNAWWLLPVVVLVGSTRQALAA